MTALAPITVDDPRQCRGRGAGDGGAGAAQPVTIDFGAIRAGAAPEGASSEALTIENSAPADSAALDGSVLGASSGVKGSGAFALAAAGSSTQAISVGLDTSTGGREIRRGHARLRFRRRRRQHRIAAEPGGDGLRKRIQGSEDRRCAGQRDHPCRRPDDPGFGRRKYRRRQRLFGRRPRLRNRRHRRRSAGRLGRDGRGPGRSVQRCAAGAARVDRDRRIVPGQRVGRPRDRWRRGGRQPRRRVERRLRRDRSRDLDDPDLDHGRQLCLGGNRKDLGRRNADANGNRRLHARSRDLPGGFWLRGVGLRRRKCGAARSAVRPAVRRILGHRRFGRRDRLRQAAGIRQPRRGSGRYGAASRVVGRQCRRLQRNRDPVADATRTAPASRRGWLSND